MKISSILKRTANSVQETRRSFFVSSSLQQRGPDQILPADDFRAWLPNSAVKLRMKDSGPQSAPPISVPTLFKTQVENLPNNLALRTRDPTGEYVDWTWTQYYDDVRTVAKGFISLGLQPFHTVAILGHHSPEWHMSNLGAIHAGGFATGIYQTNSPTACEYIAQDSRANIIVVGDQIQLEKILSIRENLPHLKAIVLYEGTSDVPGVVSWNELLKIGKDNIDTTLDETINGIGVNQCCILCYTSGTTGNPKGTMLSHDSITYAAIRNTEHYGWQYGTESVMSYLPQSHIAGMMMDVYLIMSKGGTCYFADKNALKGTLIENLKLYQPSKMMGVTRVFEKVEEAMKMQGASSKGLKKKIGDWAKSQALHHHQMETSGKSHNSVGYQLARKLVFSKVHAALGLGNAAPYGIIIGGAAVSPETVRYFLSLDIKLLEIISMTEASACVQIGNRVTPGDFRIGKVGTPYQDQLEVKLINEDENGAGEMLTRGRAMCMGYLNNEEKTKEAMGDDGWFHSGDLCKMDAEGFYTIVGRIKEILITAGGENVAPTNIEDEIKNALPKIVSNVMVVGDKQKYLTCLITLKVQIDPHTMAPTDKLEPLAADWVTSICGEDISTLTELMGGKGWEKVKEEIDAGVERANEKAVSNVARVKKWKLIEKEFSVDGGELGPSLKLKRFHVVEMYRKEIEEMYQE